MAGRNEPTQHNRILLSRDLRLAALAKIDFDKHPKAAGLTVKDWENLRRLCEAIELSPPNPHVDVLASKCRWKRRNLLRIAALGRCAGILGSSPQYDESGRAASQWWVCWDRLSVWAGEIDEGECNSGTAHRAPDCTHRSIFAPTGREIAPTDYSSMLLPSEEANPNKQTSSYLPGSARGDLSEGAIGWRRLEEILNTRIEKGGCGVDLASRAIRVAREQGLSPEHVAGLIAHWRKMGGGQEFAAWGPKGLCWRIVNGRPLLDVDRGWPQPSDAWQRYEASRKLTATMIERRREVVPASERYSGSMLEEFRRQVRERSDGQDS
jgi:hypothetical protein